MSNESQNQDPLEFLKSMWGSMGFSLPGMVTPTLDVDELGKRIADLKAVEGWLKMNLNMLQVSIQGLEMQRGALAAMQAFSQSVSSADGKGGNTAPGANPNPPNPPNPFANAALNPALWPWNFMQPTPPEAAPPEPPAAAPGGKKKK